MSAEAVDRLVAFVREEQMDPLVTMFTVHSSSIGALIDQRDDLLKACSKALTYLDILANAGNRFAEQDAVEIRAAIAKARGA